MKRVFAWLVFFVCGALSCVAQRTTIDARRSAADGVTRGWFVEYPWPDASDASQSWRKIAGELVIARGERIIRRIKASPTLWSWNFWDGGRQVVYQEGPLHGQTTFSRMDVTSGKILERWDGDETAPAAPAWVKAAAERID